MKKKLIFLFQIIFIYIIFVNISFADLQKKLINKIAEIIDSITKECDSHESLRESLVTQRILNNQETAKKLNLLLKKYIPG